jgi:hypothetical protein
MTYRSAEDALRERTAALEAQLLALEEKRKTAAELEADVERVVSELKKSRTLMDRFAKKRALPMLDEVRVASQCNANWNEMVGDDKSRFCGKCEKNVFNLSAMSREEAELLMLEKEGNLCIRLYRRKDGTVLTQDCPVGVRKKRLRLVGVLAIGGGLAATAAGFAASRQVVHTATMGEMEMVPQTPSTSATTSPTVPRESFEMGEAAPEQVEMGKRSMEPSVGPQPAPKPAPLHAPKK